ncbi:MAG: hypothetical protein M3022_17745 [Actinomycetota bacterium]|nr:hypothetical protein [Actinomycetota bacterium]
MPTGDGICPMLAAHRNGGRTNFIGFANAWDRFATRDGRRGRTRRATERELRALRAYLEASLLEDDAPLNDLAAARAAHDGLVRSAPGPVTPIGAPSSTAFPVGRGRGSCAATTITSACSSD